MKVLFSVLTVFAVFGILLALGRRKRKRDDWDRLIERSFCFLETFCRLRVEQEVLGSAYLTFRWGSDFQVSLWAEILLFFPGSTVTLRESLGCCEPENAAVLGKKICLRVAEVFPGIEIDAGAFRICFR